MNIALVGYGKMGRKIEQIAMSRGHHISARADKSYDLSQLPIETDVAIEFTVPDSAVSNIQKIAESEIPVVCGTTGWNDHLEDVSRMIEANETGLVHASNFSLGVNLFFALNKHLANLMKDYPEYDLSLQEIHHTEKKDAPSGTAISLFDHIRQVGEHKNWHLGMDKREDSVAIEALREEDVKGTHTVKYSSAIDTIEIKHEAHTREGFALGAVVAAEWIVGRKGVYTMADVLGLNQI
jgi:4-hydroxy-tetrahydrodipicolinate reductase